MEWQKTLRNNHPKRYAIVGAIFSSIWMAAFLTLTDIVQGRAITMRVVLINILVCLLGAAFFGWLTYRQRMKQINEGGIEELVRQYEAEQARFVQSPNEGGHK